MGGDVRHEVEDCCLNSGEGGRGLKETGCIKTNVASSQLVCDRCWRKEKKCLPQNK